MSRCPICNGELNERDDSYFRGGECQELIPRVYAKKSEKPCCDPLKKCG